MAASRSDTFWSYKEAKSKCRERYSCFVEVNATEHMSLSPYYIGRIKQGVQEEIERNIRRWKFLEKYQGIIVAYSNIKLLQRSAEIYDESPSIHFDIKVDYIIFKPEIGKKLVGVVNKTSSTHIGCLVHGRFNASLAKPKSRQNGWIGGRLEIDTEFVFRVVDLQTVAGVLSIVGQIKDKDAKHFRFNGSTSVCNHKQHMDVLKSSTEASDGDKKKKKLKEKDTDLDNDSCRTKQTFKTGANHMNHRSSLKVQRFTVNETRSKRKLSNSPDSDKKHKKKRKKKTE